MFSCLLLLFVKFFLFNYGNLLLYFQTEFISIKENSSCFLAWFEKHFSFLKSLFRFCQMFGHKNWIFFWELWYSSNYNSWKPLTISCRMLYLRCLTKFRIRLCIYTLPLRKVQWRIRILNFFIESKPRDYPLDTVLHCSGRLHNVMHKFNYVKLYVNFTTLNCFLFPVIC